jgi:hypothetical protein
MRLNWTAGSKPNLQTEAAPGQVEKKLRKRFPMLPIRIYDAQTNAREEIWILQLADSPAWARAASAASGSRVGVDGPLPPHCVAR